MELNPCLQQFDNFEISCISDFVQLKKQILSSVNQGTFESNYLKFRGESEYKYRLNASLNRYNPKLELFQLKLLEEQRVKCFHEQIEKSGLLKNLPNQGKFTNEWTQLIQAQHAGVHTTLLDWSDQEKIALFFAVQNQEKFDKPGKIWIQLLIRSEISDFDTYNFYELNPKEILEPMYISPLNFNSGDKNHRFEYWRFKQKGEFSLNAEKNQNLIKVVIPAKSKEKIRKELCDLNISKSTLFYKKNQEIEDLVNKINQTKFDLSLP